MVAIIGGEPHRFRPLIDRYRQAGLRAGHSPDQLKVGIHSLGYVADSRRRPQTTSFPVMRKAFLRSARNAAGRQLPVHTSTPCSDPPERSSWAIRKPSRKKSCA